ncbi:ABC transporter substrate-binding protein [Methylovulum miyakonense]|uniref:ABC transporter substrate-binding protein n=1 Tax=Methylovulum miyakonense TaxID=645578 RepID=UPI000376FBB3|nr:ABC transporter substrate-binding protein [Methylovulum miyakonense]
MTAPLQRLGFSLSLIILAAAVLLWSDRHNRDAGAALENPANRIPIAILQHSSNPMMDEIRQGVLDGLHSQGYDDGHKVAISFYNAENDLSTGNLIAQKIVGGDYKLAVTISTVMLQAVSNANRAAHIPHVFGAVTSPVTSGVGIKALDSLDKPAYMTGIGTPQPVTEIFRLAKHINPALKTVGVVWNPAETNSEYCTRLARAISEKLGITLLEASIEQSKDVREAAESLVARGAQAFWTGGDSSVNATVESLTQVAKAARIPVFSNITGHTQRGSLFDFGADYHEVGAEIGRIAGTVLAGADPAQMPVKAFVPKRIQLNEKARSGLRDAWVFGEDLYREAGVIIQLDGTEKKVVH